MNRYKVDYNHYGTDYPFALYAKLRWWQKWQHIASFKTKDEAKEYFDKLNGLPIYLNTTGA